MLNPSWKTKLEKIITFGKGLLLPILLVLVVVVVTVVVVVMIAVMVEVDVVVVVLAVKLLSSMQWRIDNTHFKYCCCKLILKNILTPWKDTGTCVL